MHIPILHHDPDLVVVDKPVGIPTHAADPADPYPGDALRIVLAQTGLTYLGMHQRLDAETSGVLLFSARREANQALAAAFERRAVRKVYLALVHGEPRRPEGVIDAPIVRDRGERYRVAAANDPRGLPARTRYRVITRGGAGPRPGADWIRGFSRSSGRGEKPAEASTPQEEDAPTPLEIIPETGRPHQIRVHLAHIGCPVVGDSLYDSQCRPAPRLCLHAYQLTLPHPATGEPVTFTALPPFPPIPPAPPSLQGKGGDALPSPARRGAGGEVPPSPARRGVGGEVALALARRAPLAADPDTTIYRLINAAADGLPGLTADRYGDALVVNLYEDTLAPDLRGLRDLEGLLAEMTSVRSIYVKYRPRQASRIPEDQIAALAPPAPVYGPNLGEFVAHEEGLAYLIRPGARLSVGLFPDMRETRFRVRAWAKGRRVLNCFAYTCGFGVAAMAGGAARVLNLDLSKSALEWGKANYRVNGLTPDDYDFVYGDVFDWLARLAKRGDRFDLVILDPPGFSRTKSRAFSAERNYSELAALAAAVTAADGLLLACCNVADLPWRSFRDRVLTGVRSAGRSAEVAGIYHEPAVDFPVAPGDESYLKMLLLRPGQEIA